MTVDAFNKTGAVPASQTLVGKLPLPLRLALREFRAGLSGFYVFIACIALGVAVIAGVGALGDALRSSFERQGATLLGGDATLARPHQRATAAERTWIDAQGRVSETATVRSMARRPDGEDQILVEIKGVDARYPLVGTLQLSGGLTAADALLSGSGVAVEPIVLERLGLKLGDTLQLGTTAHVIRATIVSEPDKIADRMTVGPRLLIATTALEKTGLIDPGSLVGWRYAVQIADPAFAECAGGWVYDPGPP
jgi:putative ABC transport system permease protein